jgi:5-methylcytosine-specific restriction endonuclease McrA
MAKMCIQCNTLKDESEFYSKQSRCKLCFPISRKIYYEEHKEEILLKCREYRKKHCNDDGYKEKKRTYALTHKEQRKKVLKRFREKNKDIIKRQHKEWRSKNKEKLNRNQRDFTKKNPEYIKAIKHKRRIQESTLTENTIKLVYEDNIKRFGTLTCYLCLKPIELRKDHLEHKVPLSKGGTNDYNNLAVACQHCNCSKGNKTEEEYLSWINGG